MCGTFAERSSRQIATALLANAPLDGDPEILYRFANASHNKSNATFQALRVARIPRTLRCCARMVLERVFSRRNYQKKSLPIVNFQFGLRGIQEPDVY